MRLLHLVLHLAACRLARGTSGNDTAPQQIHIAFAGKDTFGAPTGMRIAWFTQDLPSSKSMVKYGTLSGQLHSQVVSSAAPTQYLDGYGYHHVVDVINLKPSTRYYYIVGSNAGGWSDEWSFKAAPSAPDADVAQISLAAFGDWGYLDSVQRPLRSPAVAGLVKNWSAIPVRDRLEALRHKIDMIWHLGDIGYADDAFSHGLFTFLYEECYNGFMNWIQNLSAVMPYMVSPGNHEAECHSAPCVLSSKGKLLSNFSAYNARWHMPSPESGGRLGSAMWYSWNYGPVHFVSINTETDWNGSEEEDVGDSKIPWLKAGHFGAKGEYLKWLEEDLEAAAHSRAAARSGKSRGPLWIVAGGHRPYGDIKGAHTALFEKYGVDLYIAGHVHSYTRSTPVNGVNYIVVGGAGNEETPYLQNYATNASCNPAVETRRKGSDCEPGYAVPVGSKAFYTEQMAIGVLTANVSALHWSLLDAATGEVLDQMAITAQTDIWV